MRTTMFKRVSTALATILLSTTAYAGDPHIVEVNPDHHVIPPDGAYYIGDWKSVDGNVLKDCYAKVLRDNSNGILGTSIICPNDPNFAGK